eukprot:14832680-Ditylum_brightwellii.AAC.1
MDTDGSQRDGMDDPLVFMTVLVGFVASIVAAAEAREGEVDAESILAATVVDDCTSHVLRPVVASLLFSAFSPLFGPQMQSSMT